MVIKVGSCEYLNRMKEQAALIEITRSREGGGFISIALLIRSQSYRTMNELNISAKRGRGKINCYIPDTPINYCNYDGN